MNAFEYAAPKSIDEAVALLGDTPGDSAVMAGGTDLVTALKQGIVSPKRVVGLRNIDELKAITSDGTKIRIGAMATLDDLAAHDAVKSLFPSFIAAINGIGSRQITAIGTVGGDLCQLPRDWYFRAGFGLVPQYGGKDMVAEGDNRYHAIFGNDGPAKFVNASALAPALIALGAEISVAGAGGKKREITVEDLFRAPAKSADGNTTIAPNEIVTHITVPMGKTKNAHYAVKQRHGLDWPIAAAAVAFDDSGGSAKGARVVLGHVAPTPWVSKAASKVLEGASIDADIAAKAGAAAVEEAKPLSGNAYKVRVASVAVKRAILAAIQT